MSGNVLALTVAIVGVVGTLASALLAQLFSLRLKRVELDERQQLRAGEQAEERRRTEHMDRRDSCIAVNMAARRFRQALKNCLFDGMDEALIPNARGAGRVCHERSPGMHRACRIPGRSPAIP